MPVVAHGSRYNDAINADNSVDMSADIIFDAVAMTYGKVKGTEMNIFTSFRAIEAQEIAANLESYLEHGVETRYEYLQMLSDDYGVDIDTVHAMADVLGPMEDFDGLVTSLEDLA